MAKATWILLTVFVLPCLSEASKILLVFPFPGTSHRILGDGFVRLLTEAGHEVTYITPFLDKNPHPKLHQIDVSANVELYPTNLVNLKAIMDGDVSTNNLQSFLSIVLNLSKTTLRNDNVQEMLNNPNLKFDLVIIEWMFSELYPGLSAVYDCPYIWFSSVEPHWIVLSLIDEYLNPAYNPNSLSDNIPPFTFRQRIQELLSQVMITLFRELYLFSYERVEYKSIFAPILEKKAKPLPSYDDMRYNASIMLGNSHVSLGQATRLPQSYKAIGGYHIDPKIKPLTEDLKKLMESAKNGVIYFSLGSNLKSKDLPETVKRKLLNMFGGLKYTVIWKFEEVLPDLPKNVHILKWAPQPSILSHPNCKLFITHGGLLSTTETIHFGVPIIGIPVFADQNSNVERAVKKGFAKRIKLSYNLADDLKIAIDEILTNPSYKEKVKELSLIYHDRPVPPGKELVHWVEHVIRTKGAPHLRSPALFVPWYQKTYLDLIFINIAVIFQLKFLIKRLFKKKESVQKKNN